MLLFVVRRLLISIPVIIAASILSFVLVANAGDPLGEFRLRNPPPSPEVIELREKALNLDKPVIVRYGMWAGDVIRGDFGNDNGGLAVGPQLSRAVRVTIRLIVVALVIAVVLAVFIGTITAVRQYSALDYAATFASFLFYALPVFWLAVLLKNYLAIPLNDATEAIGLGRPLSTLFHQSEPPPDGFWAGLGDSAGHIVLPALTLILISFAAYSRYTRSSMLDVLGSDYVRTAKAKGVPRRQVVLRHGLRNALIPVVTVVAIDFGALLSGAIVTENVFQWRGMGTLLIRSVQELDVNLMQAWLLVSAVITVVGNLLADVIYAYLDPRIRLD